MNVEGEIVGYVVARLLIPLFTLGWVRIEPLSRSAEKLKFRYGFARRQDGVIYMSGEIAPGIGFLLACLLAIAAGAAYFALTSPAPATPAG